jgi:hypothetical protein
MQLRLSLKQVRGADSVTYRVAWWRYRVLEILVAICCLAAILYLRDKWVESVRADVSPAAWLSINDIYIPDHAVGDAPEITFDRTIKEEFQGYWIVEVQKRDAEGNFHLVCTANGIRNYDPAYVIPNKSVGWKVFAGGQCAGLSSGEFRVRVTWIMRKPGWPEKTLVKYSNVFSIRPAS